MNRSRSFRRGAALVLALAAGSAAAHPGHGSASVAAGLAHPLGADHLLAMLAVGLWSAAALPAGRRLAGPAMFVAALVAGALAGHALGALPLVEPAIAASVLVFGAMMGFARRLSWPAGLALVAAAGGLHGLAHGAELPGGLPFAGYAAGFVATTAALHLAGLRLGDALLALKPLAWRAAAAGMGLAGLALLMVRG